MKISFSDTQVNMLLFLRSKLPISRARFYGGSILHLFSWLPFGVLHYFLSVLFGTCVWLVQNTFQIEAVILCSCHDGLADWAQVCKLKLLNWLCVNSFLYFSYAFLQSIISFSLDKLMTIGSKKVVNSSGRVVSSVSELENLLNYHHCLNIHENRTS